MSLGLVPDIGGSVSHFRAGTTDLMRPLSAAHWASGDVLGTAIFPMVPYANRFEGNLFQFGGAQWEVETNNPPERFNVHGTGWRVPWTVDRLLRDEALLSLDHAALPDPYASRAEQRFVLTPECLFVTMTLINRGTCCTMLGTQSSRVR